MRPKNILLQTTAIGVCNIFLHTPVEKNYNSAAFFFRPPFMSEWAWILWNKMHSIKMHLLWIMWEKKNKYSNNTARRFPSLFYKKNQSLLTILAKNNNIPIIISLYIPWHFLALFKFKHTCNSSCQQAVFLFVFQPRRFGEKSRSALVSALSFSKTKMRRMNDFTNVSLIQT